MSENKNGQCDTCLENSDNLMTHHVLPRSLGGLDHKTNIVNICDLCHSKIHSHNFIKQATLIKKGIEKRRDKKLHIGPPIKITDEIKKSILSYRSLDFSFQRIAAIMELSIGAVHKVVKENLKK